MFFYQWQQKCQAAHIALSHCPFFPSSSTLSLITTLDPPHIQRNNLTPQQAYYRPGRHQISNHRQQSTPPQTLPHLMHSTLQPRHSFNMAATTSTSLMQSLLSGSEPDNDAPVYSGPPIGYSALIVYHITPIGYLTTLEVGNANANRPALSVDCEDQNCFVCAPPNQVNSTAPSFNGQFKLTSTVAVQVQAVVRPFAIPRQDPAGDPSTELHREGNSALR